MEKQEQKVEVPNTLVFHRRLGDKVCQVQWAAFSAIENEKGVELFFYVRGEQVEESALTNAEFSIFVDEFDLDTLIGKRFEFPSTYNTELDDYVSCVYYYDHKDFDNIVLEILDRKSNSFHVRWSGTTDDIDFYDGSEPENRVIIEAVFEFQETREATYNHPVIEPKKRLESVKQKDEQEINPDQLQLFGDTN